MTGCLVGMFVAVVVAIFGMIRLTLLLMATSVTSIIVGPETAVDRIAESWIEESAGRGVNLGYHPATRAGVRVGAVLLLIVGWIVTIGVIYLIVSMAVN